MTLLPWLLGCALAPCAGADGPRLRLLELRSYAGAHAADYSTVGAASELVLAGRTSVGADLLGPLHARVDGLLGRVGEAELGALAGRVYGRSARYLLGLSLTRTALEGGIGSWTYALHGEVYEAPWMTSSVSLGYERKSFGDSLSFAELFLRFYPSSRVLLASGVSYAVAEIKQTRADVVLRAEWTLSRGSWISPAVFAQYGGNLLTRACAGLTLYFDELPYAQRERRDGMWAARFD